MTINYSLPDMEPKKHKLIHMIKTTLVFLMTFSFSCASKPIQKGFPMITENDCYPAIVKFLQNIHKDGGFQEKRIRELLGNPESDESPNVGPMYSFESMFGTFWISKRSGSIVMYSVPESENKDGSIKIEEPKARQIAIDFIKLVMTSFSESEFGLKEIDTNNNYLTFEFEEIKKKDEVSHFKNFISVTINGESSEITDYSRSDLTFIRKTNPPISKDGARKIIEDYIKPYRGKIITLEMAETPDKTFLHSKTVWQAIISYSTPEGDSKDIIEVDATTGETIQPSYDESE